MSGESAAPQLGRLPLGDFAWLKLYYFDVDEEVAAWMVRQYNRTLDKEPAAAARWLAELAPDRSVGRRGLRWFESFTFRNPEGYRDGNVLSCGPTSYDLFHLLLEEADLGWNPNVTLDPALVGRWTGERSDDGRAVTMEWRGDASFAVEGLPLSTFAQQWCVYDGGAALTLRLVERPGRPLVEWSLMPLSSSKVQFILPGCTLEMTHAGKGEPSYLGEWLGGGELRARATGLRLSARAGDGRQWLVLPSVARRLAALGRPALQAAQGGELGRMLGARYAQLVQARAGSVGDDPLSEALLREQFAAQERVAFAGDRLVIAPHPSLFDQIADESARWLDELLSSRS
jgi:hypothetical protein